MAAADRYDTDRQLNQARHGRVEQEGGEASGVIATSRHMRTHSSPERIEQTGTVDRRSRTGEPQAATGSNHTHRIASHRIASHRIASKQRKIRVLPPSPLTHSWLLHAPAFGTGSPSTTRVGFKAAGAPGRVATGGPLRPRPTSQPVVTSLVTLQIIPA